MIKIPIYLRYIDTDNVSNFTVFSLVYWILSIIIEIKITNIKIVLKVHTV